MKKCILCLAVLLYIQGAAAQKTEMINYKTTDSTTLTLKVFYADSGNKEKAPAMVFFFGGGWITRSIGQFGGHASYFAKKGITCFIADYRVQKTDGATPYDCVADAKSAMRYIRAHAEKFNIDTTRIVASGGSAGGHLAAATALVSGFDDPADDLGINCKPNALVLFNPVIDNGPGGYGYERIGDNYLRFSPMHNITQSTPPTIVFLGEKDHLIPVETMQNYQKKIREAGGRCDLFLYPGVGHGFFNQPKYKTATIQETEKFLKSLNYIVEAL